MDKIVGPGNIYVATAKRKVFGKVGIDMIAGPSEILVLADGTSQPRVGRRRPAQPGRARQAGQPGARHRQLGFSQGRAGGAGGADPAAARAAIARASVDTNGKIIVTDDMNKAIEL